MVVDESKTKIQALRQAYFEIKRCEKARNYDRAYKVCTRVLKIKENDPVALKCQLVCLIQMSKFEEALKLGNQLEINMPFEKAYCLYRLGLVDEAIAMLAGSSQRDRLNHKELLAQLYYKKERYQEASDLITDVLKNSSDDFDEERKANLAAILSELCYSRPELEFRLESNGEIYEQLYNEGCFLIAKKQYQAAERRFRQSEEVCRESLEQQDATEEEMDEELYVIRTQIGCCKLLVGDVAGANAVFTELAKNKTASPSAHAVALNNLVCLRKDHNIFDARKKMKTCQNPLVEKQLNNRQKETICFNSTVVSILGNQTEAAQHGIDSLRRLYGRDDLATTCLIAALSGRAMLDELDSQLSKMGDLTQLPLMVSLSFAQAYVNHGRYEQAFDLLSSLGRRKFEPAIISVVMALCESVGRTKTDSFLSQCLRELSAATDGDEQQHNEELAGFLESSANFYTEIRDHQAAIDCLNRLWKMKPDDVNVLANLMNAYLEVDEKKAKELSKMLLPMDGLVAELDVDALENSNWMQLAGKQTVKRLVRTETPIITKVKKTRKRKRKSKLPKNFDPEKLPDPERWLPRYERAAYRKKKDKRMKDREVGRGTQGAVSGGDGEVVGHGSEVNASPKPTTVQPVGPRQMHPAPQKPKKKKKGGRW